VSTAIACSVRPRLSCWPTSQLHSPTRIFLRGCGAKLNPISVGEFGFDKIERSECPEAGHLLYKVIAKGNQKRAAALVTNLDLEKWSDDLSDGPLAMALLDRIVRGAIIMKLTGKSYRAEKTKALENHAA
jgi:hypothetical protein